jgi:hypothetical protein
MSTLPSTRRRSSTRTPLRRILLMAATVVLAVAFAASPASAKPVTTTFTLHSCFDLPGGGQDCFDQTVTTFTNTVQEGKVLAVHIRADVDLIETADSICRSTRTLHFSVTHNSVLTPGDEHGETLTKTIGAIDSVCSNGETFHCTIDATFHEVAQPDGLFRTVYDRERGTCD